MSCRLEQIYRYPVKGLNAQQLESVALTPGKTLPGDRRYALALGSTAVDGLAVEWMPKNRFLALVAHEKLATLETEFDVETDVLTIKRRGRQLARGKCSDRVGRSMIEDFFAAYMKEEARGRPKMVTHKEDGVLTDTSEAFVSIINLASIRDLERVVKAPVHPLRFRANFYVDGLDPWAEFDWVGREISVGDDGVRLVVDRRIERCAATNVNPETAERDLNIPKSLHAGFRHIHMGVYARVVQGGPVRAGDAVIAA